MGQFSSASALQITKDAIAAALNSGSIKLIGTGRSDFAEKNANADALYLSTLANSLYEQLKAQGE
jgi:hypothetical protein